MKDASRILYYYAFQTFDTGSPKALAGFIETLDRQRFEPVFLATARGPLIDALVERGVRIEFSDAGSLEVRHPGRSLGRIRSLRARLKEINPALVHVMAFEWNLDLALAAWTLGIPVILHVHLPEEAHFRNLTRFAATKVLFCSEFARRDFGHLDRIAGKTEVLHNPSDIQRFSNAARVRSRFGFEETDVVIATVAQICERKGIDTVLEAARLLLVRHDNLRFALAGPDGPGESAFAAEMRRQAAEDPALRGRVHFLGSRQDIPELLASADLFFLPTRHEPFGIVVVEAMAAGLPAVVSRLGGIPEIVVSPEIGRMPKEQTAASFAEAIGEVLALQDRGREMGARARDSVTARFGREVIGRQLARIYEDILKRK